MEILDNEFTPAERRVEAHTAVIFAVNALELVMVEYVLVCVRDAGDGIEEKIFETPVLTQGEHFLYTFTRPGTYHVFDDEAPESRGTIVVAPAPPA